MPILSALQILKGREVSWDMRLEQEGKMRQSFEDLRKLVFKEFVASKEKQQAKQELINLRWRVGEDLNKHIESLEELMEESETDRKEAFGSFFISLPDEYKTDLTITFEGVPPSEIFLAYKRVNTHISDDRWAKKSQKDEKNTGVWKNPAEKNEGILEGYGSFQERFGSRLGILEPTTGGREVTGSQLCYVGDNCHAKSQMEKLRRTLYSGSDSNPYLGHNGKCDNDTKERHRGQLVFVGSGAPRIDDKWDDANTVSNGARTTRDIVDAGSYMVFRDSESEYYQSQFCSPIPSELRAF